MELATTLLLILCYGLAAYLAWSDGTPIYLITLVAGHISSLVSPLWRVLYGINYDLNLIVVQTLLGQSVPLPVLIGAGWYYPLPALVVYYLYVTRWWFPTVLTGVMTYLALLLYYLLIESFGLRANIWAYSAVRMPPGFSTPLLAAIMAALIAYGLLYVVLLNHRSTWPSMLLVILPAPCCLACWYTACLARRCGSHCCSMGSRGSFGPAWSAPCCCWPGPGRSSPAGSGGWAPDACRSGQPSTL